jgi:hypothetical protein
LTVFGDMKANRHSFLQKKEQGPTQIGYGIWSLLGSYKERPHSSDGQAGEGRIASGSTADLCLEAKPFTRNEMANQWLSWAEARRGIVLTLQQQALQHQLKCPTGMATQLRSNKAE